MHNEPTNYIIDDRTVTAPIELRGRRRVDQTPPRPAGTETASTPLSEELEWENETAAANYFVRVAGHRFRYDHTSKRWYRWAGHYWELDETNRVFQDAKTALGSLAEYCTYGRSASATSWASRLGNRTTIINVLGIVSSEPSIACTSGDFDLNPFLLAATNGVIDLRTGEIRPGQPEDMISKHVPYQFAPGAPATRWEQFLREVFDGNQELIDYVRQVLGYALTGSTREQVFWVLSGTGENGKSKFLDVLLHIVGDYGSSIGSDVFNASRKRGGQFDLATLPGLRVVTCSDTSTDPHLDAGRLKSLTGEDRLSTDVKYQDVKSFKPVAKIFIGVNGEPTVDDDTHAFWRRMCVIPFNHQFGDEERDRDILDRLLPEAEGIFAWMVEGATKWFASGGLKHPDSVTRNVGELREGNDPLSGFISDCCELDPEARYPRGPFVDAYYVWATKNLVPATDRLSSRKFQTQMKRRFAPNDERTGSTKLYVGIRLK